MTVDRLGALEAALRQVDLLAVEMGHSDTLGFNEAQERILEITTPLLLAAGANLSRVAAINRKHLTTTTDKAVAITPTPDQGALDRARECIIEWGLLNQTLAIEHWRAVDHLEDKIAAALIAAASEARAAAIEPLRPHLIARVERYGRIRGEFVLWGYHCKVCNSDWAKDAPEQHHAECALATPAQSEGK